jgi:hypothetical protein
LYLLDGPSALRRAALSYYRFIFLNDMYVIIFTWVLLNASPLPIDAVNRRVRHVVNSPTCCAKRENQKEQKTSFRIPTIMAIK